MSSWLLSIVGVTVIGVLVELLLTDSPMSKFVRSIYAFFILFVIVQPLPAFFRNGVSMNFESVSINSNYIDSVTEQRIVEALKSIDINATVSVIGEKICVVVNSMGSNDVEVIIQIVVAVTGTARENVEVRL